jgi:hypothetical protein
MGVRVLVRTGHKQHQGLKIIQTQLNLEADLLEGYQILYLTLRITLVAVEVMEEIKMGEAEQGLDL